MWMGCGFRQMAADGEGFFERSGGLGAGELASPRLDRRAAHAAAFGLMLRNPGKSAVRALTEGQQRVFAQVLAAAGIAGLIAPAAVCTFAGLAEILLFALVLGFRIWL